MHACTHIYCTLETLQPFFDRVRFCFYSMAQKTRGHGAECLRKALLWAVKGKASSVLPRASPGLFQQQDRVWDSLHGPQLLLPGRDACRRVNEALSLAQ